MKTIYNPHSITMRVRILHQKGLTVNEIATKLGLPKESAIIILDNLGLKPNKECHLSEKISFPKNLGNKVMI